MSNRYKGGIISATPPTTTGGESGTASGAWTLEQQMQAQAAGLWPLQPLPKYIENVFSTWLYTGTGAEQTITNGINLSGKGGLVWIKWRSGGGLYSSDNALYDTTRGVNNLLVSNSPAPQVNTGTGSNASVSAFNSNGFSLGADALYGRVNYLNGLFASWTFREQPKFFDIVTYTGNQAVGHNIPHNLGSVPGVIIVKAYDGDNRNWFIYHRSLGATKHLVFTTAAETVQTDIWNDTEPTSTQFTVGDSSNVNQNGRPYVAYLFAHNAGGFGLSGEDNVISCGSYVGTGAAGNAITLGYEPQWLLVKNATTGGQNWEMFDNMRGLPTGGASSELFPNTSDAERTAFNIFNVTATGFVTGTSVLDETNASGNTYIYIAIRRGPMKVPESGTSVFSPTTNAGTGSQKTVTTNFPVDLTINSALSAATHVFTDRLRGGGVNVSPRLYSQFTDAETNTSGGRGILFDSNTGFTLTSNYNNGVGDNYIYYGMRRAPGFFDVVCYTGTSVAGQTFAHNLGVVPEMMIVKSRNSTYDWFVYHKDLTSPAFYLNLNTTAAESQFWEAWYSTAPTASLFTAGRYSGVGASGNNYVNYLFATCPGVSKVGSYTGTGALQTINCGFTGGARFVLIKRTNSTGDWYVWDSARGIVAGDDPYLLLNSTAAEVTNTDYIDTYSAGFEISSTAPAAINASGGTFIFLAIS